MEKRVARSKQKRRLRSNAVYNSADNMVMVKYDDGSFINDSYIWHFTGPRMGGHQNKKQVVSQIWEYIKNQYE